jgi:hypothetical protein
MPRVALLAALVCSTAAATADDATTLSRETFQTHPYGEIPAGWTDCIARRPSRGWIVDGAGFLRPTLKRSTGLLSYDGYLATARPARQLTDAVLEARFKTLPDDGEVFGIVARRQPDGGYYCGRFRGAMTLELVAIVDGTETLLGRGTTLRRYTEGDRWRLEFAQWAARLTAIVRDDMGTVMARVDAVDSRFTSGPPGLVATPYAAAEDFTIRGPTALPVVYDQAKIRKRNARLAAAHPRYAVVRPHTGHDVDTPPERLRDTYDIVVAGAGTGGLGTALQAARLGARVLLLEETDWIGGQAAAAGVTSMDEDGVYGTYPVRERGLYREFHESLVAYYRSLDKDPFVAYYSNPQQEGGYEPKIVRAVLNALILETRDRQLAEGHAAVLDLCLRTRVERVHRDGHRVIGVTCATAGATPAAGMTRTDVSCRVLVDATEYGDVLPLAGVPYRLSNGLGGTVSPTSPIQDHTWLAVVREYPEGVPAELRILEAPPGYDDYAARRFRKFQRHGVHAWGAAAKGIQGPRDWRVYFAWRGMADTESPLRGLASELRHTQCGFNGGNDYPVTAATCDDPDQRRRDERFGIERTLGVLHYFQHELGLEWSVATDEGFDTPANRAKMRSLGLRPDLERIAVHLPPLPYVREARRMVGVDTLRAADLTRYADARHVSTAVAMGDYFMDLDHGRTGHLIEPDLDPEEPPHGGGPFQVPMAVFLPETLDGFLAAEKNFSQSRLANGATRLQPITMLTGQAVGAIAALAVRRDVPPRDLPPSEVQSALLDAGSTLIQRWYADVAWGTPIWKATQLLSLHQILDRPGPIDQDAGIPLGSRARWGVAQPIAAAEAGAAIMRLAAWHGRSIDPTRLPAGDRPLGVAELRGALAAVAAPWEAALEGRRFADHEAVAAGEFALVAAAILLQSSP